MKNLFDELYTPYLKEIGLKESSDIARKPYGTTYQLDPDIGQGYYWVYVFNDYFSITQFELNYHHTLDFSAYHPTVITLGNYSKAVADAILPQSNPYAEALLGYYTKEGKHHQILSKNQPLKCASVSFTPEFYSQYLPEIFKRDFSFLPKLIEKFQGQFQLPEISNLLNQMVNAKPCPHVHDIFYQGKIFEFIAQLIRSNDHLDNQSGIMSLSCADLEIIQDFTLYLDAHFTENIRVSELCKRYYISQNKLTDLFKKVHGLTILEYILRARIEKAKILLSQGNHTMLEIAHGLGYQRASSFSELFKIRVGISPREFQKKTKAEVRY